MRRKFILSCVAAFGLAVASSGGATAQDARTLGVMEDMVALLKEANEKLAELIKKQPVVQVKRAPFSTEINKVTCTTNADCDAKATVYCNRWGYPKGEHLIYTAPNTHGNSDFTRVVCFD